MSQWWYPQYACQGGPAMPVCTAGVLTNLFVDEIAACILRMKLSFPALI